VQQLGGQVQCRTRSIFCFPPSFHEPRLSHTHKAKSSDKLPVR